MTPTPLDVDDDNLRYAPDIGRRTFARLRRWRWQLVIVSLCILGQAALMTAGPALISFGIDEGAAGVGLRQTREEERGNAPDVELGVDLFLHACVGTDEPDTTAGQGVNGEGRGKGEGFADDVVEGGGAGVAEMVPWGLERRGGMRGHHQLAGGAVGCGGAFRVCRFRHEGWGQ